MPKPAKVSGAKAAPKAAPKAEPKAEVIEPVEKVEAPAKDVDYDTKKVAELKELAKEKGLTGFSAMKKAELVELLKNS
ncbi:MAG: Rho termination factor N-terminal domain-containing protein [Acholeplasmataceae bacterium]